MRQSDQLLVSGTGLVVSAHSAGSLALVDDAGKSDELWRRWWDCHDISAAMQLAKIHRQLLVEIVETYTVVPRLSQDLIAEGHIGLMRAICRFDPDGIEDFSAFATRHVHTALRDYAEILLGECVRRPHMVLASTGRRLAAK